MTVAIRRAALWSMLVAGSLGAAGCGGQPRHCIPVSGRVTLKGAALPAPGHITFTPVSSEPGVQCRPCQVPIAADGRYRAAYDRRCRGLFPGTYRVGVTCWRYPQDGGPEQLEALTGLVSLVPERYCHAATSGLVVEVAAGARRVEFSVDLE